LLGRCSRQLRSSCEGANVVYLQAEGVYIRKHYFALKLTAAVREAFSNAIMTGKYQTKQQYTD
jgi:hypothetical protein